MEKQKKVGLVREMSTRSIDTSGPEVQVLKVTEGGIEKMFDERFLLFSPSSYSQR